MTMVSRTDVLLRHMVTTFKLKKVLSFFPVFFNLIGTLSEQFLMGKRNEKK